MAWAYSMDMRQRIINDCNSGMNKTRAAEKWKVSYKFVLTLCKRQKETGSIAPEAGKRGRKRKLISYHSDLNVTLICWIKRDGMVAPMSFTGGTTNERFLTYVRDVLCPELKKGADVLYLYVSRLKLALP